MAPELPVELKYMILDYLRGDKRSISTCSMLSQTWQYPARTLLFHSVSLRVENVPTKPHHRFPRAQVPDYDAFVKTIPSYLRHAVRSLTMSGKALPRARGTLKNLVEFYGYDDEAGGDKAEEDMAFLIEIQESLWTTLRLDVVLRTVQGLPLLQTLSLSDFVLKPTEVSDAPLVALESITLRSVATRGEDDILRLFDALGADEITLDVFSMYKGGKSPGVVQDPLGLVLTRSLDICHGALRLSQAVYNLAPLTCLTVSIRTTSELKGLKRVLSCVAPNLKRFALNLYDAFRVTSPYASMSREFCPPSSLGVLLMDHSCYVCCSGEGQPCWPREPHTPCIRRHNWTPPLRYRRNVARH